MSQDHLTRGEKARITRVRAKLLAWFERHGRSFPWRSNNATVYEQVCVEVLLQRTRAETVAKLYDSFFDRYPGWSHLAAAPVRELEEVLKPIGLWRRRARSVSALAKYADEHGGIFPENERELLLVPAVGQYVANSILLFQCGKPKPLIDVNMARFLERYVRQRRLADIRHDPWLQDASHWLVGCKDPVRVNWATLDHAAVACRARSPVCPSCKLRARCNFALDRGQS